MSGQADHGGLEKTVRVVLFGALWEGQQTKEMRRGGDATAVALTKVIGEKNLGDNEVERALDILQAAFSDLSWVSDPADREPRTALFVLQCLDKPGRDPALRQKIAITKKALTDAYAGSAVK